jgi:hypothetical protein
MVDMGYLTTVENIKDKSNALACSSPIKAPNTTHYPKHPMLFAVLRMRF